MTTPCIASFGEIMLRLCPPGKKRFSQAFPGIIDSTFGGGEANVCASIASLGGACRYLTALPDNPLAHACAAQLRGIGADVSHIHYDQRGRMGVYYAEHGSNMRGSNVIYDREGSTISLLAPEDYDFKAMLSGATHLHLTGITPSLSRNAYLSTLEMATCAKAMGLTLSIDLNYRKKLWNWEPGTGKKELANRCLSAIVARADLIIGNEEDAADVFGITSAGSELESGKLNIGGYKDVAGKLSARFPQAKFVAITLRESYSADHNNWGGMLYDCAGNKAFFAPLAPNGSYAPYPIHDIVDRFGGGDSFCAALIFALGTPEFAEPATAIHFAVASSALKHTIPGDYNMVSRAEVENLMKGSASGRVQR